MVKGTGWSKELALALAKAGKKANQDGMVLQKKKPVK
jgi:hypothetical protein